MFQLSGFYYSVERSGARFNFVYHAALAMDVDSELSLRSPRTCLLNLTRNLLTYSL